MEDTRTCSLFLRNEFGNAHGSHQILKRRKFKRLATNQKKSIMSLNTIEEALTDIANGKVVIVVDDEIAKMKVIL